MRRRVFSLAAAGLLAAAPAAWGQVNVDLGQPGANTAAPTADVNVGAPAADVNVNAPAPPKADVGDPAAADVKVDTERGAALNQGLGPGAQDKLEARRQLDRAPDVNVNVDRTLTGRVRLDEPRATRNDDTRVVVRRPDNNRWRYKYHNNHWWYWKPNNSWVIWYNGSWVPYSTETYYSYYPRTYSRTYSDGYYDNGYQNGGYYGGYSRPYRYGTGYRGGYYGNGYYGNGYGNGYYGRGGYGGYRGGYYGSAEGAVGSEIGRGIGGRRGANIGEAVGGAIGGF